MSARRSVFKGSIILDKTDNEIPELYRNRQPYRKRCGGQIIGKF